MGKRKRHRNDEEQRQPSRWDMSQWELSTPQWVIIGAVVIVAFAAIAVTAVTIIAGSDGSQAGSVLLPPTPATEEEIPLERSAAADILDSKTWDEMSQEERDLVRSEMERVHDNADFRLVERLIFAIDIARRDGHTVASRQYRPGDTPGGDRALWTSFTFYCPTEVDGTPWADVYRYGLSPLRGTPVPTYDRVRFDQRPTENYISSIRWDSITDLGWDEINGHRVHGFRFDFTTPDGTGSVEAEYWVDVDDARLRMRVETSAPDAPYLFDWRPQPPIIPPIEGDVPCANGNYDD